MPVVVPHRKRCKRKVVRRGDGREREEYRCSLGEKGRGLYFAYHLV